MKQLKFVARTMNRDEYDHAEKIRAELNRLQFDADLYDIVDALRVYQFENNNFGHYEAIDYSDPIGDAKGLLKEKLLNG